MFIASENRMITHALKGEYFERRSVAGSVSDFFLILILMVFKWS